jgi:hypothetical protein
MPEVLLLWRGLVLSAFPMTDAMARVWFCSHSQTSFCFKCKGKWFEDHRPALCDHMTRWGDSIFSGESATQSADADATLLNQIYMFNNTVRCPRECLPA